jgi:hypothetical protein
MIHMFVVTAPVPLELNGEWSRAILMGNGADMPTGACDRMIDPG